MKKGKLTVLLTLSLIAGGCSPKESLSENEEDILVVVGDSALRLSEVERKIPGGLSAEDSIEMFHSFADRWIESRVLEEVAEENVVDLDRIDRMTEAYRNRLIVDEYLRKMEEGARKEPKRSDIETYYLQYGDSMRLEQPLVKGIFLKTTASSKDIDNIRKLIFSATESDIDELEKIGLKEATGYEYFADRWVEWSDMSQQIPVRIEDADSFLKDNHHFEISHQGMTYFLNILDYVPSGEMMPREFALSQISEILTDRLSVSYRKNLLKSIYRKAMKDGKLKKGSYDPMEGLR